MENLPHRRGSASEICRACGGETAVVFQATVLGRYQIDFMRCQICESLQTQRPFWIAESYTVAIGATDTGVMIRNLRCQAAVYVVATLCRLRGKFLDSGGGAGVLCRLLRDQGFDAYLAEKYADPVFARAFSIPMEECHTGEFTLISAMEVMEHFEDPGRDIDRLFALRPEVVVATTQIYRGEGKDWWYLSTQSGQHVFFYSAKCLNLLARKHGYNYFGADWIHVFSQRPLGTLRTVAMRLLLSNMGLAAARLWLTARLRGRYANRDNKLVCEQLAMRQAERPHD